jgi:arabinose-5-phosphate isomerase
MDLDPNRLIALGRSVIQTESEAVVALIQRIDESFARACQICLACQGRIVVTGMGKSGHVGSKIAATLASTGSPAFFVHPGEASHGDLGMITPGDAVIALSNSGETDELLVILPLIKRMGIPLISITGGHSSTLARAADVNLDASVSKEACPLNLAPTASTTVTLVLGDALAVALLEARGFTPEDFARSHPGGRLGRRLLLHVRDLMHAGDDVPSVAPDTSVAATLLEMSRQGLGMTTVVGPDGRLIGVYTDGDLRRTLDAGVDLRTTPISDVMSEGGRSIGPDELAAEAVREMEDHSITALAVVDHSRVVVGVLHMHDLLKARVV